MQTYFKVLSQWLISQKIIPAVATSDDASQEDKTFWQIFPEDDNKVNNCVVLLQYDNQGDAYVAPGSIMHAMQLIFRNQSHMIAMTQATNAARTLQMLSKGEPIIDITYEDDEGVTQQGFFILRCDNDPTKLNEDAQGRFLYSVSFYITTNI